MESSQTGLFEIKSSKPFIMKRIFQTGLVSFEGTFRTDSKLLGQGLAGGLAWAWADGRGRDGGRWRERRRGHGHVRRLVLAKRPHPRLALDHVSVYTPVYALAQPTRRSPG